MVIYQQSTQNVNKGYQHLLLMWNYCIGSISWDPEFKTFLKALLQSFWAKMQVSKWNDLLDISRVVSILSCLSDGFQWLFCLVIINYHYITHHLVHVCLHFSKWSFKIYLHYGSTHMKIPKAEILTLLPYFTSIMTVHWLGSGYEVPWNMPSR